MGAVPIQIENFRRAQALHASTERFVTVSPLGRPCILLGCQSDSCMSTKWVLPPMCAMPNILSGRRHMDTVLMESPACCKSPTPRRTVCNGFTVRQALYVVVLSIGQLYEHHMGPTDVCGA